MFVAASSASRGPNAKPTIKGSAAYATTSGAIPTHAIGDLIIITPAATSAVIPTKPTAAGTVPAWTDISAGTAANGVGIRTARFIATATNHTSGTWTNAATLDIIVITAGTFNASTPIGGQAVVANAATANSVSPAITMTQTDGSSLLLDVHFCSIGGYNTGGPLTPPTGTTRVVSASASCVNTKTVTTSDGTLSQTQAAAFSGNAAATIEVLAA